MELTNLQAVKIYFGMDNATAMKEIKALPVSEREELGKLCKDELTR